ALLVSALVAWQAASSIGFMEYMAKHPGAFFGLVILQFAAVIALAGWVQRMSAMTAVIIFLGYAALTGLTLSTVLLVYTPASIVQAFLATAAMFGGMSLYGLFSRRDLSGWGSFLFMSLIGIIVASLINLFLHSPMLDWMVTYGGIVIFAGLAAYDNQKLKYLSQVQTDEAGFRKLAIHGALTLYLDFINLFLLLLRTVGDRR
ncbi:MAG: Bax inhibitor-1/YccA family protein, partial [Candidatus Peregrinibacteria bacterium]